MSKTLTRLIVALFVVTACFNLYVSDNQQFSYLAESFLHGKTYFLEDHAGSLTDTAPFDGRHYWPLGPFPAVILMPFVFVFDKLNLFFYQGYLQFFIVVGVFYLCTKIARKQGYSLEDARFLAYAFCFSSVFLGTALCPWSWYLAHVVAVFLLFLSIQEYLGRQRLWIIGLLCSLALITRFPAGLNIIFFASEILLSNRPTWDKAKNVSILFAPFIIGVAVLGVYNYSRFGSWAEQGYSYQVLNQALTQARLYGVLSFVHVPGNLYYFLLSTPLPVTADTLFPVLKFPFVRANPWGMSILITSPYFVYLIFLNYKDLISKLLIANVCIVTATVSLFFGIGYIQFGYRFALDFLPFLFFLLIRNYREQYQKLTPAFKILIIATSLANLYLLITHLYLFITLFT